VPIDEPLYPVNLRIAGHRCLVVGGGRVALQKARGLRACGAIVDLVAPSALDELQAIADRWEARPYGRGDVRGYRIAMAATDDATVNAQVHADGVAHGTWVNSADQPEACTFVLPSVVRRGPMTIAIGTGGQSPAFATWLRRTIEDLVTDDHELLLALCARRRAEVHESGASTEGLDWQSAIAEALACIRRDDRDGAWHALVEGTTPAPG